MANGLSSERERETLNFFLFIILYTVFKLFHFEIPVPKDLANASLAANLFAKQE